MVSASLLTIRAKESWTQPCLRRGCAGKDLVGRCWCCGAGGWDALLPPPGLSVPAPPAPPVLGWVPRQPLEPFPALLASPWKMVARAVGEQDMGGQNLALGPASLSRSSRLAEGEGGGRGGAAFGREGSFILNLFVLGPARSHGPVGCWGGAGVRGAGGGTRVRGASGRQGQRAGVTGEASRGLSKGFACLQRLPGALCHRAASPPPLAEAAPWLSGGRCARTASRDVGTDRLVLRCLGSSKPACSRGRGSF